jgi:Ribonuclease G/E
MKVKTNIVETKNWKVTHFEYSRLSIAERSVRDWVIENITSVTAKIDSIGAVEDSLASYIKTSTKGLRSKVDYFRDGNMLYVRGYDSRMIVALERKRGFWSWFLD